jgi:2-oxoacid:acceptor oxidoreductase delta subunit (pyruvate/2-ketoisovalerate family)
MEARVGVSRYANVADIADVGNKTAEAVGIKGANLDRFSSGITTMNISGYSNPLIGYSASLPWNRAETNFNFVNNWTKILRNHTIKFGVDIRRIRDELLQVQTYGGPRGIYNWRNLQTSIQGAPVLDQAKCNYCGLCAIYCPPQCMLDKGDHFESNLAYCKGCGICAHECPRGALTMVPEGEFAK